MMLDYVAAIDPASNHSLRVTSRREAVAMEAFALHRRAVVERAVAVSNRLVGRYAVNGLRSRQNDLMVINP